MTNPLFAILANSRPERKTPHDVFVIPDNWVAEFLRRMDDSEDDESEAMGYKGTVVYKRRLFNRWLASTFPFCRGQNTTINTEQILQPSLWLYGPEKPPVVGRKYEEVIEIPADIEDEILRLICLTNMEEPSPRVAAYNLWSGLSKYYPQVARDNWSLSIRTDSIWLTKKVEDSSEEDDE